MSSSSASSRASDFVVPFGAIALKLPRIADADSHVVTFEPCAHYGRTPPCADALIAAGIRRVVIADGHDPDPRVSGRGVTRLRAAGIQVETGLLRDEAWPAHAEFVARSCSWHEGHHS